MNLRQLADRCDAKIEEVARTILVQFKDSLLLDDTTHVPDRYITRILFMYGKELGNKRETSIRTSYKGNGVEERWVKKTKPAKSYGNGIGQTYKLKDLAKDFNVGISTLTESLPDVFNGDSNPNSRVYDDVLKRIMKTLGFSSEIIPQSKAKKTKEKSDKKQNSPKSPDTFSPRELLEFFKQAVNKTSLTGEILGYNDKKDCYFVEIYGFKALMYHNESDSQYLLEVGQKINVVPLKVAGNGKTQYMTVSRKRLREIESGEYNTNHKEQLKHEEEQRRIEFHRLVLGYEIDCVVSKVEDNFIIVEFGQLHGIIYKNELFWNNILRASSYFKIGMQIKATLISKAWDAGKHKIQLSYKKSSQNPWDNGDFNGMSEETKELENASILDISENGAVLSIGFGIEGFMPRTECLHRDWDYIIDSFEQGNPIQVFLKDVNKQKKSLIFSRKPYYEEAWQQVPDKYEPNKVYSARILCISDYGMDAELEKNVEIHIPAREISWVSGLEFLNEYHVGEYVTVLIENIDTTKYTIYGSIRKLVPNPWETYEHIPGDIIQIKIIDWKRNRLVVQTSEKPFLIGKVRLSEIDWFHSGEEYSESLLDSLIDIETDAKILRLDSTRNLLELSIRQTEPDPWENIRIGAIVEGSYCANEKLIVLSSGLRASIPSSELSGLPTGLVSLKVIECNRHCQSIEVSRNQYMQDQLTDNIVRNFFRLKG